MRIPRKADLINLQELYKTDAKIAEALGGIPEYLVAYWRRKKGVPSHSAPKFTQAQILDLWERYGDDFRCGRDLNISKAAFYSWRRKYGITEKPAVLKLEQLELRLDKSAPEPVQTTSAPDVARPRTSFAKIRARFEEEWPNVPRGADWHIVRSGGAAPPVAICPGPHPPPPLNPPPASGSDLPSISTHEPAWCWPDRGRIDWQLVEARAIQPGQLVSGPRLIIGGLGGVGTLVLDPDCPEPLRVVKIEVTRRLSMSADAEDIALAIAMHGWEVAQAGTVIEFLGGPIERLSVDRKVKLCSLAVALGATAAMCPFDDVIRSHYGRLLSGRFPHTHPDRTAFYDSEHFLEGRGVHPQGALWEAPGRLRPVSPSDMTPGGVIVGPGALPYEVELAATLVQGHILSGGTLLVCPATSGVYCMAQRRGWTQSIVNAGGSVLDVALVRRLGWQGLADVARSSSSGRPGSVYSTNLPHDAPAGLPVVFTGLRTAMLHAQLFG